MSYVQRDPVPWLLDPENPSARLLALRDILGYDASALARERAALLAWAPVRALLDRADTISFWGRAGNPYFGGAVGTFGTLYALAQLGVPVTPLIAQACEQILREGRLANGAFAPSQEGPAPWFAYTGMALVTLRHFGLGDDPRSLSAEQALVQAVTEREALFDCQMAGAECPWGLVKAMAGLLATPVTERTAAHQRALAVLGKKLLTFPFDFDSGQTAWSQLHYPRYYGADLIELCHVLAQSGDTLHPRFRELHNRLRGLQTEEGRWRKIQNAPGNLQEERMNHPSRWLTYEAVHTLMLVYGEDSYAR